MIMMMTDDDYGDDDEIYSRNPRQSLSVSQRFTEHN